MAEDKPDECQALLSIEIDPHTAIEDGLLESTEPVGEPEWGVRLTHPTPQ